MTAEFPPPLRPFQVQAIQALTGGLFDHLIVQAPTGSGKSRIFQELIRVHGRRVLLISPLVALSRQHRKKMEEMGVSASLFTGGSRELPESGTGAWILSPESASFLLRSNSRNAWKPDLMVVDECHTLWEWGRSFRPSIAALPDVLQKLAIRQSLWLSATLPPGALAQLLGFLPEGPRTAVQGSFALPARLNLRALNLSWGSRLEFVSEWAEKLKRTGKSGVLFAPTRFLAERFSTALRGMGVSSAHYHAGLSSEERQALENLFQHPGRLNVLVATSAFGMGMDFDHLEEVVLWQPPSSLLSLAQAMGRVARADRPGRAWILWDRDDYSRDLSRVNRDRPADRESLEEVFAYLEGPTDPFSLKTRLQTAFQSKSVGASRVPGLGENF